jgi:hypothetical protein
MFITCKYYNYAINVYIYTHTNTHMYTYICIYIYILLFFRSGAFTQSSTRVSAISNQIVTAR